MINIKTKDAHDLFNLRKIVSQFQTNVDFNWNFLSKVLIAISLCLSLSSLIKDLPVRHNRTCHSFLIKIDCMLNPAALNLHSFEQKKYPAVGRFLLLIKFTWQVFNHLEYIERQGEGIWIARNIILFLAKINKCSPRGDSEG